MQLNALCITTWRLSSPSFKQFFCFLGKNVSIDRHCSQAGFSNCSLPTVPGVQKLWMDFTGSLPTSSRGKGFSASVLLKQILTFRWWNFQILLLSRALWPTWRSFITSLKISCIFSWKKPNPNKIYGDVVRDHSYTRFPVLTYKFLASETWITCHTLGYVGYTKKKDLIVHVIFINTLFVLMKFGLTCATQLFSSVGFSKTLQWSSIWHIPSVLSYFASLFNIFNPYVLKCSTISHP